MPSRLAHARRQAVRAKATSAYSQRLQEGEERVGRLVAAGTRIDRRGPRECLFFEGEVGMQVDLGGLHLLMTEPERDDRDVDTRVQEPHCGRVSQYMESNPLLPQRRTGATGGQDVDREPALEGVPAESPAGTRRKERVARWADAFAEPRAQHPHD